MAERQYTCDSSPLPTPLLRNDAAGFNRTPRLAMPRSMKHGMFAAAGSLRPAFSA